MPSTNGAGFAPPQAAHTNPVADNRLNREFQVSEPNTKWTGDITSIETAQGWLYLAVVIDLYSRLVIGWSMSAQRDEALVENALGMALARRSPSAALIFHSDQGSQYTSHRYQELLNQHGITASMSRKGNCWDNAPTESFFGTLKTECAERKQYENHAQARSSLFEYIETFYNRKRRHSSLGYVSPVAYEQQGKQQKEEKNVLPVEITLTSMI